MEGGRGGKRRRDAQHRSAGVHIEKRFEYSSWTRSTDTRIPRVVVVKSWSHRRNCGFSPSPIVKNFIYPGTLSLFLFSFSITLSVSAPFVSSLALSFFLFWFLVLFRNPQHDDTARPVLSILLSTSGQSKSKYSRTGSTTQCDTIVHKELTGIASFSLAVLCSAYRPSSSSTAPHARSTMPSSLIVVVRSIEREPSDDECPSISSFRLNIVQALPVRLERDPRCIESDHAADACAPSPPSRRCALHIELTI